MGDQTLNYTVTLLEKLERWMKGRYKNKTGDIVDIDKEKGKAKLLVDEDGKLKPYEVDLDKLKPIPPLEDLKPGNQIGYLNSEGKIEIGMVKEIHSLDPPKIDIEVPDRLNPEKNKVVTLTQDDNLDSIRKHIDGQKFDFRELKFPIAGNTLAELMPHMKAILCGEKTEMINKISSLKPNGESISFLGKIQLQRLNNGEINTNIHAKRKELKIPDSIMGVVFTPEMKEQLMKEGHLGIVDGFTDKQGVKFSAYVSVDQNLNSIELLRADKISISKLKGVELTEEEKNILKKGGEIKLETEKFKGTARVDASKQKVVFKSVSIVKEKGKDFEEYNSEQSQDSSVAKKPEENDKKIKTPTIKKNKPRGIKM